MFPFNELNLDMQNEVISKCDLPTRICLSWTCHSFRTKKILRITSPSSPPLLRTDFNALIHTSARSGYCDIIKFIISRCRRPFPDLRRVCEWSVSAGHSGSFQTFETLLLTAKLQHSSRHDYNLLKAAILDAVRGATSAGHDHFVDEVRVRRLK